MSDSRFPFTNVAVLSDDDRDELLGELAEEFATRVRSGDRPRLSEYQRRHPELAGDIGTLFTTIISMEGIKGEQARDAKGRVTLAGHVVERLGDFRIVRQIGTGGMGVVFEAEQVSLKRNVALKVLPRQLLLRPEKHERFQHEAQLAAGLHHSNIVPVYGCGYADGYHFYAMQLIAGTPLNELHRGNPAGVLPRRLAEIGLEVAEALEYAHQHGVLHRDIKPANLIEDADGRIWVTDFGLASRDLSGASAPSGGGGTKRYMAPERSNGTCDPQSDIYSLGVTLSDLATAHTSQPPSQSASTHHTFLPLASDVQPVERRLPRDLDAVICKAMAADRGDRYRSASELADDLRRFLVRRPVRARPQSLVGRFYKFVRRNRALSACISLLMLLAWTADLVYQQSYAHTKQQNDRLSRAIFTVDALLWSNTVGSKEARHRNQTELRADRLDVPLLNQILPEGDFDPRYSEDPQLLLRAVKARRHVGRAQWQLGNLNEAKAAFEYALETADRLRSLSQTPAEYLPVIKSARLLNDLSDIAERQLDFIAAEQHRTRVLELLDAAAKVDEDPTDLNERARAHLGLGRIHQERFGLPPSWGGPPVPPSDVDRQNMQDGEPALEHLDRAITLLNRELQQRSDHAESTILLSQALRERARRRNILGFSSKQDEEHALTLAKDLAQNHPESPDNRFAFAEVLADVDVIRELEAGADEHELLLRLEYARELAHSLTRSHPERAPYIECKVHICRKLAILCRRQQAFDAAEEHIREAIDQHTGLVERFPGDNRYRAWQGILCWLYAELLDDTLRPEKAQRFRQRALRQIDNIPNTALNIPFIVAAHDAIGADDLPSEPLN